MVDIFHTVGLVAIGRNEGERLQRCLLSVPQGIPVVYVDSASTDGSVAFAKSTNANVVELDMTLPFTAARARNEGLERLQRDHTGISYVQFVDGDCEMEPDWFSVTAAFLSAKQHGRSCLRTQARTISKCELL